MSGTDPGKDPALVRSGEFEGHGADGNQARGARARSRAMSAMSNGVETMLLRPGVAAARRLPGSRRRPLGIRRGVLRTPATMTEGPD